MCLPSATISSAGVVGAMWVVVAGAVLLLASGGAAFRENAKVMAGFAPGSRICTPLLLAIASSNGSVRCAVMPLDGGGNSARAWKKSVGHVKSASELLMPRHVMLRWNEAFEVRGPSSWKR
jgi:hypothetical protein